MNKKRASAATLTSPKCPMVEFTKESLKTFETLYKRALVEGRDDFPFEGHPIFVGYAKYVIEYLKGQGL